ncbi:hypothetical protein TNCV_572331 [Trichonephila clavipes]|nr:hypothetical protein TNCV_572331 [Trichonephila clavipes]
MGYVLYKYRRVVINNIEKEKSYGNPFVITHQVILRIYNSEKFRGCSSPVIMVLDHSRYVMSSSPVPIKPCRVRERCTLNLSRDQTSFRWCGVVVRRGGASSGVVLDT